MSNSKFRRMRELHWVVLALTLSALICSTLQKPFTTVMAANVTIDLSTPNAFDLSIIGAQQDDRAGASVAVGDLNGDRIDDLVVGIPGSDGPNGRIDSGEVRIFFGKSGLSGTFDLNAGGGDIRVFGADPMDQLGSNLAFIDVNADKVKDLVIAAPGGDAVNNTRESAGELYVLFGGRAINSSVLDFFAVRPDLLIIGPFTGSRIGSSMIGGDFTGDGNEDLILGASDASVIANGQPTGVVYGIVSRTIATPPFTINLNGTDRIFFTLSGAAASDRFGAGIAIGDVNRDRQLDVIVTAPNAKGANGSPSAGNLNIFYGPFTEGTSIDLTKTSAGFTLFGPITGARLGEGLAVGDIDADQIDDIIVTAPGGGGPIRPNAGQSFVFYGSTPLLGMRDLASSVADASFTGVNPGDQIGTGSSVMLADIDKDNFRDVIVGAPNATSPAERPRNGGAFVLLKGGTRFEQRDLQTKPADIGILGARPLDQIGSRFALGDINGDGKPDLIIAAPLATGTNNRANAGRIFSISNFNPNAPGNNQSPTLSDVAAQRVPEGASISVDVSAVDPDGAVTLTLVRPPTPSFVTLQDFGNGSGRITITPPAGSQGVFTATIRATDNGNPPLSVQRDFSVTVTPPAPNITNVVFDGIKSLIISGTRFGASPRVIINSVDRTKNIKAATDVQLTLKGKPKKLGLVTGNNNIQVIDSAGAASSVFVFRL